MAKAKGSSSETKVTRISASDSKTKKASTVKKSAVKKVSKEPLVGGEKKRGIIGRFFGYFSGAWYELRQVRWPTRRATWGLTVAVLAFSAFFVIFILLLDTFFNYIFETILK